MPSSMKRARTDGAEEAEIKLGFREIQKSIEKLQEDLRTLQHIALGLETVSESGIELDITGLGSIWRFPKIGVPPNHRFEWDFP